MKNLKKLIALGMTATALAACSVTPTDTTAQTGVENKTSVEEGVTVKHLTLNTEVGELAANLYLPENAQAEDLPLVIVTGAWTSVKEQMPATYAKALTEQGYAALTFDFRGWGESSDSVQYLEDPQRKTDDIRAVIKASVGLDQIDSGRIYGMGICASAGYMLDAVSHNPNIQAAAVVAPWLHDKPLVDAIYGGESGVTGLIQLSENADSADAPVIIEAASATNDKSLMYQAPYYTETDRGLIPEYDNRFNVSSWKPWLTYDAQRSAAGQDKPVLIVASESMAVPAGAKQYESNAENVESVWLDNVTQFDFYDRPEPVALSASAVAKYFSANK